MNSLAQVGDRNGDNDLRQLQQRLAAELSQEQVLSDPTVLNRLSGDLSMESFQTAVVGVVPENVTQVQRVVACAREMGFPVVARGAGMSYTRAHTPSLTRTVLIDMRRMDAVRTVSARDRYVVVEAGCTWEQLYLRLAVEGLRSPFWGPLSGRQATIGGTLSQNSVFYGSALHGTAADSVLGIEAVMADGSIVRTGSWAKQDGEPFSRHFGPDLTGLFLGDAGAFGLKTAACLAVLPLPSVTRALDLPCDSQERAVELMERISGLGVASDVFAFDPLYHELLSGLGFRKVKAKPWSVHAVVEGQSRDAVDDGIAQILARTPGSRGRHQGSIALALRADPFRATQMLFSGAPKDVHLPLHAVVPFSRAAAAVQIVSGFLEEMDAQLRHHEIKTWQLMTVAGSTLVLEPSFYFRGSYRDPDVNAAARTRAVELRHELTARLDELGSVHMQVGKFYPYLSVLADGSRDAMQSLKTALDPAGSLNPGALGL